jgi:hypothetical protein
MESTPENIPEAAAPVMALAVMNIFELVDMAQRSDPKRKTTRNAKNDHFKEKLTKILPARGPREQRQRG